MKKIRFPLFFSIGTNNCTFVALNIQQLVKTFVLLIRFICVLRKLRYSIVEFSGRFQCTYELLTIKNISRFFNKFIKVLLHAQNVSKFSHLVKMLNKRYSYTCREKQMINI